MVKPIMNLDEVEFDDIEENGIYTSKRASISRHIGAQSLGYNLTILPPGKVQCPFHCHHGEEEMFFILEGEGELRFGDKRFPIRQHDVIACPTGGAEVAHQIINTGMRTMRYLALSTLVEVEACEYPIPARCWWSLASRALRGCARCSWPRTRLTSTTARRTEPFRFGGEAYLSSAAKNRGWTKAS
ncbi:cupin domain-containing protein [Aminobacter anthyllidis]|uniref:cupin domain-containing protein n=1 Tax=Aminobacter anthyllidis TaxID=1035067 RepID=UPI001FEA8B7C|nr:cupin domain-containing protein [Aminobacter anthyllidis]